MRADVHTENEFDFGVSVEDANDEFDVNIVLESVRECIATGLRVTVVVKLGVIADLFQVDKCWVLGLRLKDVGAK